MKKLIIIAILAFVSIDSNSQYSVLKFEKDSSLTRILNSISYYKVFMTSDLAITIIVVGNESGSANLPEGHEVSSKVFIGVSDFDLQPKNLLYSIDNLYTPKDFKIAEKNSNFVILKFTHGPKLTPLYEEIKITNEGLSKLKL